MIVFTPGGVGLTADLPGATIWSPLRGCAGRKVRAGRAFPVGGQQTAATISFAPHSAVSHGESKMILLKRNLA